MCDGQSDKIAKIHSKKKYKLEKVVFDHFVTLAVAHFFSGLLVGGLVHHLFPALHDGLDFLL